MKYLQAIDLYEKNFVTDVQEQELCKVQYIHALTQQGMLDESGKRRHLDDDQLSGRSPLNPVFVKRPKEDEPSEESGEAQREFWSGLLLVAAGCLGAYTAYSTPSMAPSYESRKHAVLAETVTTTFKDMRGVDECLEEVKDVVDFLGNPEKYHEMGARLPKGVLLTGEPGSGKTMLARAIAGEANVKFFYNSGSDFEELYVGVGAKRVRELFAEAKKQAPAIIFIDEIDALGTSRHSEEAVYHRQSLNQLLVEMDGFRETDNIVVIAATNMKTTLDPALRRAGRFDKEIYIPMPTLSGRKQILELYLSKVFYDDTVNVDHMAKITTGMSGAALANLVNVAMTMAVKAGRTACSHRDLELAFERIALGVERKSLVLSPAEKRTIAIQQAGSFLTGLLTNCKIKPRSMTILPRGRKLGNFMLENTVEMLNYHRDDVLGKLDIYLGGRIAVELFQGAGQVSNHSEESLQEVSSQLHSIVRSGMFREYTGFPNTLQIRTLGNKYLQDTDSAVKELMDAAYDRTKKKLAGHKTLLEELVEELLEKETMSLKEVSRTVRFHCGRNGVPVTDFYHLE